MDCIGVVVQVYLPREVLRDITGLKMSPWFLTTLNNCALKMGMLFKGGGWEPTFFLVKLGQCGIPQFLK